MSKSNIQELIDKANETWGDGMLILPELGGHMVNEEVEVLPLGIKDIDDALGIGGFPFGRVVEIMGQESSGKTTLVLHIIAKAQQAGKRCAFIDAEHALDRDRAKAIGVDFDKLAISQPDSMENALELLEFLVKSNQISVIILDSVAALVPEAELAGEMNEANIGLKARMMGKILRKIIPSANKNKVMVIFINQVRAKLGGFGFVPMNTTPGGNALKFASSVRLDLARTGNKMKGQNLLYTTNKMVVKKNKLAPPARVVNFKIGKQGIFTDTVSTDVV